MIEFIVHNRIRLQRGLAFVAILMSAITVVGVWKDSPALAGTPWFLLLIGGTIAFFAAGWFIGLLDERFCWQAENTRYNQMNPQIIEIINRLDQIERKLK